MEVGTIPWFKVDDKLHSHPKARRAGLAAMGLWSLAGSHCMDYLTDGVVEAWFVEAWPDGVTLAARLVRVGLWDEHPDGYVFHDWGEFQPTADSVRETRSARSEAGRKGAQKRWQGNHVANGMANAIANEWPGNAPSPSPSPDSSKTSMSQSSNNRASDSTDAEVIPREIEQRAATVYGITSIPAIIAQVKTHTGRDLNPTQALQVSNWLLGKAKNEPKVPQRYVFGAIARSPFEVQKHIDEAVML